MVYRPSQGHKVTLGSTRNIQCTTPNQFPKKRDTVGSFDLQRHGKEHTS